MIKELISFLEAKNAEIIFIPHSFSKDDIFSNDYKWMRKINSDIQITNTLEASYNIYKFKKVDIIFAQRFHSIVLSQVYDIPFIAFNYSTKTKELLNDLK
jgi:polysaccharide pyruvyl transferase WcaK-like protein